MKRSAQAFDLAGNTETAHVTYDNLFYLQAPGASISITQPPGPDGIQYGLGTVNTIINIIGSGSGMRNAAGVHLSLQRLSSPTSYWADVPTSAWVNDPTTFTAVNASAGTPQAWSFSFNSPYTVDNSSYQLVATPYNGAGIPGVAASVKFVFDKTIPIVTILSPAGASCGGDGTCLGGLPTLSGTAVDPNNPSPPSLIQSNFNIRLKRLTNGQYWNGTAFVNGTQEFNPGIFTSAGSPPTYSWSTTTLAGASLKDGEDYAVIAHALDLAGNDQTVEGNMANFTFIYDTTPPVGYFVQPSSGQVYKDLNTISGTAFDPAGVYANFKKSDIASVQLQIIDANNNVCWNEAGSQFNLACPHFFVVTGTSPWSYSNAALTPLLTSGHAYTLTAKAIDNAGNAQGVFVSPASSVTIHADQDAPSVTIIQPVNNGSYKPSVLAGGSALSGTASDPEAPYYQANDAIGSVQTVLWYASGATNYYYTGTIGSNGTKFSSNTVEAANWQIVNGTSSWTQLITSAGDWITDQNYFLKAIAIDKALYSSGTVAGNKTSVFTSGQNLVTFTVEGQTPVSQVTNPLAGSFIQNLNTVSGISNVHLSGAAAFYLRIWYSVGVSSYYWTGSAWGAADTQTQLSVQTVGSTGTIAWTYPGSLPGQSAPTITQADNTVYSMSIQALDNAGNLEAGTTSQVILDRVGPVVTISTPMAAAPFYGTARLISTINGTSSDSPAGTNRVYVQITDVSDNIAWNGSIWTAGGPYPLIATSTNPWTFASPPWIGNKQYQVVATAYDNAGNGPTSSSIISFRYDVDVPSSTIIAPNQQYIPGGALTTLTGTAVDWLNNPASEVKSGLSAVELAIRDGSGNYWQGSVPLGGFQPAANWRSASTTTVDPAAWQYPPSSPGGDALPTWADGQFYTVQTRAIDQTGNLETPGQTFTFLYDAQPPITLISIPVDGSYATSYALSSGTFSDPSAGTPSGVSQVVIAVQNSLGAWWNGTTFAPFDTSLSWRATSVYQSSWVFVDNGLTALAAGASTPQDYTFFVRGIDRAGNDNRGSSQPSSGGNKLTVDFFPPVSAFSWPPNNGTLQGGVTPIRGTSDDQSTNATKGAGILNIQMKVLRIDSLGTIRYWGGTAFDQIGDPGFNIGTSTTGAPQTIVNFQNLASAIGDANFVDGYRYQAVVQAEDQLKQFDNVYATTTFLVDRSTPTVTLSRPAAGSVFISSFTIASASGTYADPVVGGNLPSGVASISVQIQDISQAPHSIPICVGPCAYWTASAGWVAGPATVVSSATVFQSSWVFTGVPDWTHGDANPDGRQYSIRVYATDNAGNTGILQNYFTAVATMTFDATKPLSGITTPPGPDNNTTTSLATITGTAIDPLINTSSSDVNTVYVSIQDDPGNGGDINSGNYWNAASGMWLNTLGSPIWNATVYNHGTGVWQFNSATLDTNLKNLSFYIIQSSAVDNAGNAQAAQAQGQTGWRRLEFQPPPAVITITAPNSSVDYNELIGFQGSANGVTASIQLTLVRSDSGQCWSGTTAFGWVNCVQTSTATRVIYPSGGLWAYPPGGEVLPDWAAVNNTTMTLTVTGINFAGISASPLSNTFGIDRSSPTSTITFPAVNTFVSAPPTLTGNASDAFAGQANQVSAGIKTVRMHLKRLDTNYYWDVVTSTWLPATTVSTVSYNSGTQTWSFTSSTPTLTWVIGVLYSLDVYSEDNAQGFATGNVETAAAPITFGYDASVPLVTMTNPLVPPQALRQGTSLATITGTASATAPDFVSNVQMRIFSLNNNVYMTSSTLSFNVIPANSETAWFSATDAGSWTNWFVSSGIPWVAGSTYTISARSINAAGTYSTTYATQTIVYDNVAPQSGVSVPANGVYTNSLSAINGTSVDFPALNPGVVNEVDLRLKRLSDGTYWNGVTAWIGTPTSLGLGIVTVYPSSWSVSPSNIPSIGNLTSGDSYYITTSALDNTQGGGNVEGFGSPRGSTFTYDTTAPGTSIVNPLSGSYVRTLAGFSGLGVDNVLISTIQISLQDTSIGAPNCYNPANNTFTSACPAW